MISPNELINEIAEIRALLDRLEIKGTTNARILAVTDERCLRLCEKLKQTFEEIQNGSKTEQGAGEVDAEFDRDST